MKNREFVISVILAVVAAFLIAVYVPGDGQTKIKTAISWGGLILLFLFGFMILAGIASGKIDISQLLTEKGSSGASMSRFQLLIFTFVIAISLLLVVVTSNGFPQIPNQVLLLLGISATTYGVGKGIQASSGPQAQPQPPEAAEAARRQTASK